MCPLVQGLRHVEWSNRDSRLFLRFFSILSTETEYARLLQQTLAIEIHSELLFSLRRNVLLQVRIIRLNKTMQTVFVIVAAGVSLVPS